MAEQSAPAPRPQGGGCLHAILLFLIPTILMVVAIVVAGRLLK